MYYDLHIHSALSPCSDDDMTINNICNMAKLIGLDVIAITDHNSCKQLMALKNLDVKPLQILYGVEIQTAEKIHLLAYFNDFSQLEKMQAYLDLHLVKVKNDTYYYGKQLIFDENDQVIGHEPYLLINSLDVKASAVSDFVHLINGTIVLAHPYRKYGYFSVYSTIQKDMLFEGLEYTCDKEKAYFEEEYGNKILLKNSDAHHLYVISECENTMTNEMFDVLKGVL